MNEDQEKLVRECWEKSDVQMSWNMYCGDTLKEKFEKLASAVIFMAENSYIDDEEFSNPYVNLYADPQITSVFEVATAGFEPVPYDDEWKAESEKDIRKAGVMSHKGKKINIYKDVKGNKGEILLTWENHKWGIKLKIDNFIYT